MFVQESYISDPWKILVCCILLNQTTRKQLDIVRTELFTKYPDPSSISSANLEELSKILKPLGFQNKRAKTLVKFSSEYLLDWKDVKQLYGIGKYASDAYEIFVKQNYDIEPNDGALNKYLNWLRSI